MEQRPHHSNLKDAVFLYPYKIDFYSFCYRVEDAENSTDSYTDKILMLLEPMFVLYLKIFDVITLVDCETQEIVDILQVGFSAFVVELAAPVIRYAVSGNQESGFVIEREGEKPYQADNVYELLYGFEKDLTLELELQRKDLFFVHGAALALNDRAILISAPSGSGKSTTTWALLHHGFDYLSDELAPIQLESLNVEPFPHALNQKKHPPKPYDLPEQTFKTDRTMHVPVEALPCKVVYEPTPLVAMFYVQYNPAAMEPSITSVSVGQGCMNLFANGLNQLQHENKGLATATDIAGRIPSFKVETTSNLEKSALMLKKFVLKL